jgi:hypothetical protein
VTFAAAFPLELSPTPLVIISMDCVFGPSPETTDALGVA